MRRPLTRLFLSETDGAGAGNLPSFPTCPQARRAARRLGSPADSTSNAVSASHVATDGPPGGRLMQIQDNNRGDAPGSKSRHPVSKGSTDRRRVAATSSKPEDDALSSAAPPTD